MLAGVPGPKLPCLPGVSRNARNWRKGSAGRRADFVRSRRGVCERCPGACQTGLYEKISSEYQYQHSRQYISLEHKSSSETSQYELCLKDYTNQLNIQFLFFRKRNVVLIVKNRRFWAPDVLNCWSSFFVLCSSRRTEDYRPAGVGDAATATSKLRKIRTSPTGCPDYTKSIITLHASTLWIVCSV